MDDVKNFVKEDFKLATKCTHRKRYTQISHYRYLLLAELSELL